MDPEIFDNINSKLARNQTSKEEKALLRERKIRERKIQKAGGEATVLEEEERKQEELLARVQEQQADLGHGRSMLRRANSSFRR